MSNEAKHERKKFMKPYEVDRLIKGASEHRCKSYLELVVLLAVEHGASRQEILDLKWSDIDFEDGENGSIRFFRQKNQFERVQDIMPRTKQALLARREHLAFIRKRKNIRHTGDLVICHLDGNRMQEVRSAWNSLCQSLDIKDFHFHDNRHTYCTNVLHAGGTLKDAKELIGHRTLRMTDRYCEHDRDREREVQKRLALRYAQ